jgi:dephospho-CoA kinase
MFCFACTGGIGAGKSYVIRIFSALGVPAYVADDRVKYLYDVDRELIDKLVDLLGKEIVTDGVLQRKVMAKMIFSNRNLLEKVNKIVHPRLLEDFYEWREQKRSEGIDIIIYESAIFFETPIFWHLADKVIVVFAPENVRIMRVMKRDGLSEEQVRERMRNQMDYDSMIARADFVIYTDGKRAVLPQVLSILESVKYKC